MVTADSELSHAENSPSPPAHLPPSHCPLSFLLSFSFKSIHPFRLQFISPSVPAYFLLSRSLHPSIHQSIHLHAPQTEASNTSDIQQMCNCGSPSQALLFLQHIHSRNTKRSQKVTKICLHMGRREKVRGESIKRVEGRLIYRPSV